MPKQIFVNLAVKDLNRSMDFFKKLGFTFNPQFTDETAACMVIEEGSIYAMLLTHDKFKQFIPNGMADAKKETEVLICLSFNSREEVDKIIKTALENGGNTYKEPQDHGFMYYHGFQDLDGHIWEVMHMMDQK